MPRRARAPWRGGGEMDEVDAPECRICGMTAEEDDTSPLVTPCGCAGHLAHVHVKCMQKVRGRAGAARLGRCARVHTRTSERAHMCTRT